MSPNHIDQYDDYTELQGELRRIRGKKRIALIKASGVNDPAKPATLLDDIRNVTESGMDRRMVQLAPITKVELGVLYRAITRRAKSERGWDLTPRQVERRIGVYRKALADGTL